MPRNPMRGSRSWLVVAAVCALALVATVDGLQGGGAEEQDAETDARPLQVERGRAEVAAELREAGVEGLLTYSDASCELHALSLPSLTSMPIAEGRACRFISSPGGVFARGAAALDPHRDRTAICVNGELEVRRLGGAVVGRARGCSPAWKPSSILTGLRDGNIVRFEIRRRGNRLRPHLVLSRKHLNRVLKRKPWLVRSARFKQIGWMTDRRLAAIVTDEKRRNDLLAIFEGDQLAGVVPSEYSGLSDLRVSPKGTFVAAAIRRPRNLVIVDARGRYVANGVPDARAITWSPSERWAAVATPGAVSFLRPTEREQLPIVLLLRVSDLFWR